MGPVHSTGPDFFVPLTDSFSDLRSSGFSPNGLPKEAGNCTRKRQGELSEIAFALKAVQLGRNLPTRWRQPTL